MIMTREQKEIAVCAAADYKDSQRRKAAAAERKGDRKKAREHLDGARQADELITLICAHLLD